MGNLFRRNSINSLLLALTLGTFAPVAALPPQQPVEMGLSWNDIQFGYTITKLIDKGKSLLDKMDRREGINEYNTKKMMSVMYDLKKEITRYTGVKIDINKQIDITVSEMKKKGHRLSSSQVSDIKKVFNGQMGKFAHKSLFFAECMAYGHDYTPENEALFEEAHLDYDVYYCPIRDSLVFSSKSPKPYEEKKEVAVPLKLIVGVASTLCGLFVWLIPLPIPGKMQTGTFLVGTGLKYSCDAIIEVMEQKEKEGQ